MNAPAIYNCDLDLEPTALKCELVLDIVTVVINICATLYLNQFKSKAKSMSKFFFPIIASVTLTLT